MPTFERLWKGKEHKNGSYKTICGGDYWDWPWWKRVLSTMTHRPYAHYKGWKLWLSRVRDSHSNSTHFDYGDDGSKVYHPSPREYRTLGRSMASSRIKPIWWEWVREPTAPC